MKIRLTSTVAVLALIGLTACHAADEAGDAAQSTIESLTQTSPGRDLAKTLLDDSYSAPASASTNIDAFTDLAAAMPGNAKFTVGETREMANGALAVSDFSFTFMVDDIELGLKADSAEFWGFNGDALSARINGTNLYETVKLADRITFTNISSVGFDLLGERIAQEYNDAIATTLDPTGELVSPADMMVIRDYDIRAEKLVFDSLTLNPYELTLTDSPEFEAEELEGVHLLQAYAAGSRAFSLDGMAMSNIEFVMDMAAGDEGITANISLPVMAMQGYTRGDMAYLGYYDMDIDIKGAFPVEDAGFEDSLLKMDMTGGIKTYEISDLGLQNIYRAISEWKMPEHTETDFMSLGAWRLEGYTLGMNGNTVFNADLIAFDLTEFHWLLPTKLNLDVDGFAYEIGTLFESVFAMMPEGEVPEEELAQIQNVMDVLARNDLDCFCGDLEINAAWDETTGAITYAEDGNFADLFSGNASFDLTVVTPAQTAAMIAEEVEESVFEEQFERAYEFRSLIWQITDTGGLNAVANTAHEIGETFPDEPGMAMLAYNDADALRGLAVNMVRGFGPELAREVPEANPWVSAVATWLEDGGTLTFKAEPPQPFTLDLLDAYEGQDPEPSEVIELLGVSVTHTAN